jgi:glutaredoxin-like protein NrdH
MGRLSLSVLVAVSMLLSTVAMAAKHYTVRTVSLDYDEVAGSELTLLWEGEIYNDTLADATLHVVLELHDPEGNVLSSFESSAINVKRFETASLKATYKVKKELWAKAEMLYESVGWSDKDPVNGTRLTRVDLFSASWCSYCIDAADYLDEMGVAYVVHDIDDEPEAMQRLEQYNSDASIPTLVINGEKIFVGFSEEEYANMINPVLSNR